MIQTFSHQLNANIYTALRIRFLRVVLLRLHTYTICVCLYTRRRYVGKWKGERGIGLIKVNPTAKKTHGDFIEFHSFIHSSNAPAQDLLKREAIHGKRELENVFSYSFLTVKQDRDQFLRKQKQISFGFSRINQISFFFFFFRNGPTHP